MKRSELAVGVIGCGHAGTMYLRGMRTVPRLRVDAVTDVDAEAARRAAVGAGAAAVADSAELLARRIDVVAIATPPASHVALATAALAAGKDVVLERPLGCDAVEADRLAAEARRAGRTVMMAYNFRHHRHVQALRAALAAGRLGRLQALRTVGTSTHSRGRHAPEFRHVRRLGGGTLLDFGVAHFDLWRFLLGDEVAEVTAFSQSDDGDDVTTTVLGRMRSGVLVTSLFGNRAAEAHAIEAFGDGGRAAADLYRVEGFRCVPSGVFPGSLAARIGDVSAALGALPWLGAARRLGGVYLASYGGLWEGVARTLLDGLPAVATLEDGRRSLDVALAAMRSADEGRSVRLAGAGG